jgi:hypothetical protein
MSRLGSVALAVWEFIAGDDWRTALGVCVVLALTGAISTVGLAAWWVAPIAVPCLLWLSLRRFRAEVFTRDR